MGGTSRLTKSTKLDELDVGRAMPFDEVGVSTDRLGYRVGNVLLILRGLLGIGQEPGAS